MWVGYECHCGGGGGFLLFDLIMHGVHYRPLIIFSVFLYMTRAELGICGLWTIINIKILFLCTNFSALLPSISLLLLLLFMFLSNCRSAFPCYLYFTCYDHLNNSKSYIKYVTIVIFVIEF